MCPNGVAKVIPICNIAFPIESGRKCVLHGLIEQEAVPVSIEWIEQSYIPTWCLNSHCVERFPTVIEAVVVCVTALRVSTEFLFDFID